MSHEKIRLLESYILGTISLAEFEARLAELDGAGLEDSEEQAPGSVEGVMGSEAAAISETGAVEVQNARDPLDELVAAYSSGAMSTEEFVERILSLRGAGEPAGRRRARR